MRIEIERGGKTLATEVAIAERPWQRLIGLLGRASVPTGYAMVFPCCRSIHTIWMRFPIDVIVIDRAWRVVALYPAVPPWRMVWPPAGAWGMIEMAVGAIAACGVAVGDQLRGHDHHQIPP